VITPTRTIKGCDSWWCLHGSRIARLPPWAVRDEGKLTLAGKLALRAQGFFAESVENTYYLTVVTTTSCNLGCAYCFQNVGQAKTGTHRPPRIPGVKLDALRASKILAFADCQLQANSLNHLDIMLFGGEPLLQADACVAFLRAAQEIAPTTAQMVTNGTLLSPPIALALESAGLSRVQVTFDGGRESHNLLRATRSGRPTYDHVLRNLERAAQVVEWEWQIHVNVAPSTMSSIDSLLDDLARVVEPSKARVVFAPVDDVGIGYDDTVGYDARLAEQFIAWNIRALELGFQIRRPRASAGCSYCTEVGGTGGSVVNGDGVLYSCWETVGKSEWVVGDVDAGYVDDDILLQRWVACGYNAQRSASDDVQRALQDAVDSTLLDWLHEKRHLALVG